MYLHSECEFVAEYKHFKDGHYLHGHFVLPLQFIESDSGDEIDFDALRNPLRELHLFLTGNAQNTQLSTSHNEEHDFLEEVIEIERGAGFGDPIENKFVEEAAIQKVVEKYKQEGWDVRSVEAERRGYDLECSKFLEVHHVEVKGVRSSGQDFIITANERKQALQDHQFVLIVVSLALFESPILTQYSGKEFCQRFEMSPINYRAVLQPDYAMPLLALRAG